MACAHRHVCLS